jgi:hypothetical protein
MRKKILLSFVAAAFPVLMFAQGCMTIFSEDGDRFYLVLNGIKQNPTPQTNVRVDGLTSDYYAAKILFEDASKPEISKNIPVKDPATNNFAEVTYKIKRTNKGELKIRYFSATPVPEFYNPPPDMYVMHYGAPPPPANTTTTVTQTTTYGNPNGASINMNAGGVNMNINVSDPSTGGAGVNMNMSVGDQGMNVNTTQTRTATTYTTTTASAPAANYTERPAAARTRCNYAMDNNSFNSAKATIKNAGFEDTKLSTARSIIASNCLNTDQVCQICSLFGFEQSKLDFAKAAYSRTVDANNYFKVSNVFSFDASKSELNEFIGQ